MPHGAPAPLGPLPARAGADFGADFGADADAGLCGRPGGAARRAPCSRRALTLCVLSCRKHALNCHRMKPALFSVLCEIKEKTGKGRPAPQPS